jgi:LmbE family N-acetylglucosaminyl deacetylase
MRLNKPGASLFTPDGAPVQEALTRVTHMGVCAHPDDLEILAYRGILDCFDVLDRRFFGVVVTDGAGSSRKGPYAAYTDDQMKAIRRVEQKKAALVGDYGLQALLDYTSAEVKDPGSDAVVRELEDLLRAARPEVLYTHNLADKHDTHVAVALRTIAACRRLEEDHRPKRVIGGEVWRDLDWLSDEDKVVEDVQDRESLAVALLGVFDSQITGGKRYDLATLGRRRAHATYHESHEGDLSQALSFAMDLTPLVRDASRDPQAYVQAFIDRFGAEVRGRVGRLSGRP